MGFNWVGFRDHLRTKMTGSIQQFAARPDIADFARLAVGVLAFLWLLIFPPPPWLNGIVVDQRSWIRLLVLLVFFIFLLNKNGNGWETVQIGFIFALFAIPLIYKWQFAQHDGNLIGGLIPWSDAAQYTWEAHRLANGSLLSAWAARRPLFSGLLAVLLGSTGGDFMAALIVLALINIMAAYFVVRLIKGLYGAPAAAFFLIISFEFYIRFSGVTTSEHLGFAAGNFALFFLLVGAHTRSLWKALFGLGLLTLALNARAGAFFILPALILWLGLFFRQQAGLWRSTGSAILVVVTVFLLNLSLVSVLAEPQSVPFSNYSYTLYGLASGNKGWDQVIKDYPNASEQDIMPLAIQKIRSEPTLFLQGMIDSFTDYFKPHRGAFTFGFPRSPQLNLILWGIIVSGLVYSISKWREGLQSLTLASFLGVLASIPLLPPIDADGMRVYAATIPFSALWVVTGVSALSTWGRKFLFQKEGDDRANAAGSYFQKPALFSSILLVFLAIPAPLLLKEFAPAPNFSDLFSQSACEPGEQALKVIKSRNIDIIIIQNEAAEESYMPFIRIDDFQRAIRRAGASSIYPFLDEELLNLRAGDHISFGLKLDNFARAKHVWMVSDFSVRNGEFNLCGRATENQQLQLYNFYYVEGASVPAPSLTVSQEYSSVTQVMRWLYGLTIGIVLFLVVKAFIGFKQNSLIAFLYPIGIIILILQALFVSLYVRGKLLSVPALNHERFTLQVQNIVSSEENSYVLPLGIDWMSHYDLGVSPAVVYENNIPLNVPNAQHAAIQEEGNGRYSVWEGYLYFSSSDNTDPRTNGRVYELEWPRPIPVAWQKASYVISILGIALIFLGKYFTQRKLWHTPETSFDEKNADDPQ